MVAAANRPMSVSAPGNIRIGDVGGIHAPTAPSDSAEQGSEAENQCAHRRHHRVWWEHPDRDRPAERTRDDRDSKPEARISVRNAAALLPPAAILSLVGPKNATADLSSLKETLFS